MKQLIFVYNADSDLISSAKDYVTKIVSPAKYGCRLCGLTYGLRGEKREWREFLNELKYPTEFLHKDEFQKENPNFKNAKLPAVFLRESSYPKLLIPAEEINKQQNLRELKNLIQKNLPEN